ncbi:guanine deaminase [Amaricoccus sp.]|uniref:guanine deaminase n=1 Tax=Amaricoccus sp. TaxID=1872485 RepID=UPI001B3F52F0|nr:guanine deaminase [Amaricoccus sp.]MBP7241356.1 guanine deaminase [Amaricoccus sp.]
MTETLIRGRLLSFRDAPGASADATVYIEDGALLLRDGRIAAVGDHASVAPQAAPGATVIDHRPHLVLPGFIDAHIHFPQVQVIGSWGSQLLDWLNGYVFVEEQKFRDPAFSRRMAGAFFDELLRHGTTTASAFCSVHPESAEAYFAEALARNLRMIGGKVMMDRNAPEGLRDTAQQGYDDSKRLIADWHGKGRLHYAVSPRFAITSTEGQMEAAQALIAEHPELHVQTHLSENRDEIAFTLSLFPFAKDYTEVYERYGFLGPRSLMGHCVHLSDREISALAGAGAIAVFNPTSNLFLGSGLFDLARMERLGARVAVATDVGAGTSYSMLPTMDAAYKILQLQGQKLPPLTSCYMMTLGNARALGLDAHIGALEPGRDADLVVLDVRATPAMRLRAETIRTLEEELFILQTMGDDRAVVETYAAGRAVKPR